MNELALFAGAGGGILGGHLLGWRTVCAVEWEQYPASVLCARQNDGLLPPFPIWDDVQTFDGKPWRGIVDVISGGFPCQDISSAGKGAGITGNRSSMWKHMARIIGEVRPKFAFVENSPMLTVRGLGVVLGDLAEMGFDARWCVLGADSVGAPHKRDRIWILANSKHGRHTHQVQGKHGKEVCIQGENGQTWSGSGVLERTSGVEQGWSTNRVHDQNNVANTKELFSNGGNDNARISMERETQFKLGNNFGAKNVANTQVFGQPPCNIKAHNRSGRVLEEQFRGSGVCDGDVSNSNSERQQGQRKPIHSICANEAQYWQTSIIGPISKSNFWEIEPPVGRVVDGVASRVDELKALGNGQVPLCAATAWNILSGSIC